MKVLYMADTFPYPMISGGKIRTFNLLKIISKENTVDFFCINDSKPNNDERNVVESFCNKVDVSIVQSFSKVKRLTNFVRFQSDKLFLNYNEEFKSKIQTIIAENDYGIIFVDSLFLYQYIIDSKIDRKKTKVILDIHNVENEILLRTMQENNNIIVKLYGYIEHLRIKKIEKKYTQHCDLALVVSERDRNKYINDIKVNEDKIFSIENGFDVQVINKLGKKKIENDYILFVGSLWYRPNYDGLTWFINEVWPSIIEKYPHMKLKVIGKYKDENKKISKKNIEYLGFVDDLTNYYNNATCSIVPLFIGSGTRLKILESFSYKCPVLSTSVGCEGIDVIDKENIFICNNQLQFIQSLEEIMKDDIRDFITQNAYDLMIKKYDWNVIEKKLIGLLNK